MAIKVTGPGATASTTSTKKTGKASGTGSAFSSILAEQMEEADTSSPVMTTSAMGGVNALFAAQSVDDALSDQNKRKKALARGNDILDRLDEIRIGLLSGTISKERLMVLAHTLRSRRDVGLDPEISRILDEIELRAEVELAKLTASMKNKPQG